MGELSAFEGLPVVAVGVEMPSAAGGLQEAMKFDPVEWHHGDEQYVVLRTTVKKVRHEPVDKEEFDGDQRRVHVLHVEEAFPIDADAVEDYVTTQRERIKKLKDEAKGVQSFEFGDGEGEDGEGEDLPIGDTDNEDAA